MHLPFGAVLARLQLQAQAPPEHQPSSRLQLAKEPLAAARLERRQAPLARLLPAAAARPAWAALAG